MIEDPNILTVEEIILLVNSQKLKKEDYENFDRSSHVDVIRKILKDGGSNALIAEYQIQEAQVQRLQENSVIRQQMPQGSNLQFDVDRWLYERKNGQGSWDVELRRRNRVYQKYTQELDQIEESKKKALNIESNTENRLNVTIHDVSVLVNIQQERNSALDALQQAGYTVVNEDDIVNYRPPNLRKIRKYLEEKGFHVIEDDLLDPYGYGFVPDIHQKLGTDAEIGVPQDAKSVQYGLDTNKFFQVLDQKKQEAQKAYYESILSPYKTLPKSQAAPFLEYYKDRDRFIENWHSENETLLIISNSVKFKQLESLFKLGDENLGTLINFNNGQAEDIQTLQEQISQQNIFRTKNLHTATVNHLSAHSYDMDQLDLPFSQDFSDLSINYDLLNLKLNFEQVNTQNPLNSVISNYEKNDAISENLKPGLSLEQIEAGVSTVQEEIFRFFNPKNLRQIEIVTNALQIVNTQLNFNPDDFSLHRRHAILTRQFESLRNEFKKIYQKAQILVEGGLEIIQQINLANIMQDESHGSSHSQEFFKLIQKNIEKPDLATEVIANGKDQEHNDPGASKKNTRRRLVVANDQTLEVKNHRQGRSQKKKSYFQYFKDFLYSETVQSVVSLFQDNYEIIRSIVQYTTGFNLDLIKPAVDYGVMIYKGTRNFFKAFDGQYQSQNNIMSTAQKETIKQQEKSNMQELQKPFNAGATTANTFTNKPVVESYITPNQEILSQNNPKYYEIFPQERVNQAAPVSSSNTRRNFTEAPAGSNLTTPGVGGG